MDNLTKNNFFDGSLTIYQNKNGYRFSLDPILLASHIQLKGNEKIVDIGTGSGIIPLAIFYRNKNLNFKIFGVEIQKSLSEIAKKNIRENHMEEKIIILHKDINEISQKDIDGPCDIVVSNPPYQSTGAGRINPLSEKAVARHEIKLNLKMLLEKTKSILKNKGRFFIIYPARRTSELINEMEKIKITPKTLRFIHSFEKNNAVMVICQGISNGNSGIEIFHPLYIYQSLDKYSEETLKILS